LKKYDRRGAYGTDDLDARLRALRSPDGGGYGKRGRRRKPGRRGPRVGRILFMALVLVGVVFGLYLLANAALRGGGGGEEAAEGRPATVVVEEGDTLSSVADKLEEAGVIGNATLFTLQARMEGTAEQIKPGRYQISPGEDAGQIMAKLSEGEAVPTFKATIPEGLTLQQTAATLSEASGVPQREIEAAADKTDYGYAFLEDPAIKNTEGFLFPKSYEFEEGTDARGMINRLLEQYLLETENLDFQSAQDRLNLTEYELLTVASLIEREAANPQEKPLIASVIYNRLREDMPLQIDATIQYALGKPRENLSLEDLEVDSPYNTYQNYGLPPGPICSPSRDSIEAALNPAETDYLYYVLTAGGEEHFFTNNYDEFLQAKAEAGL